MLEGASRAVLKIVERNPPDPAAFALTPADD